MIIRCGGSGKMVVGALLFRLLECAGWVCGSWVSAHKLPRLMLGGLQNCIKTT